MQTNICLLYLHFEWHRQNKTLKCSVFRIRAPVPANSYILVPKCIKQSLGLTGRYFYLLFRPTPGKYFLVHLDVSVKVSEMYSSYKHRCNMVMCKCI